MQRQPSDYCILITNVTAALPALDYASLRRTMLCTALAALCVVATAQLVPQYGQWSAVAEFQLETSFPLHVCPYLSSHDFLAQKQSRKLSCYASNTLPCGSLHTPAPAPSKLPAEHSRLTISSLTRQSRVMSRPETLRILPVLFKYTLLGHQ